MFYYKYLGMSLLMKLILIMIHLIAIDEKNLYKCIKLLITKDKQLVISLFFFYFSPIGFYWSSIG